MARIIRNEKFFALGAHRDIDGNDILAICFDFEVFARTTFRIEHDDAIVAFVGNVDFALGTKPNAKRTGELPFVRAHHSQCRNQGAVSIVHPDPVIATVYDVCLSVFANGNIRRHGQQVESRLLVGGTGWMVGCESDASQCEGHYR
jgi:hypothetical protein